MTNQDKLQQLRQQLAACDPRQDIAADLIREEIRKLEPQQPTPRTLEGCNIIGVRPSDGSPGRHLGLGDLRDGATIGDNDTIHL